MSARREDTRRRLFHAAVSLIAEQGFGATSVDQIAERAGVAKGTVYYNFGGKTELFTALLAWGISRLAEEMRAAAEAAPSGTALTEVLRAELAFIGEHEAFARLLVSEAWQTNQAWYATVQQIRNEAISVIGAVLDTAARRGSVPATLDTGVASSALFGMVLTVALDWRTLQPERPMEEIHAILVQLAQGMVSR
ncbi:TetR/AcrR family transcriptional regulator [Lipingzhangella sp. LS1_29]|uniref:TetR/AcrR family transcriptional regulator n=1 Tax=Lipingzhangella rawalii TaxID=2055835 RepID=A0ABU2HB29_9ACTN|nr:TetR/AcrR family transcriptional regulator [Lipingzhangella rawalii]MDS1272192.1 TetR/AcrR family transcriptional regulator [Lipingzhangella rawalii]